MARCKPPGPSKPKKTLAKPTKAKGKPTKATKATGKKTTPAKTPKSKKNCTGKGFRKTKPPKRKTNRRLPDSNHFPYFYSYCAKNIRDAGIRQNGKITMVQASNCWKDLNPDQKQHFVTEIKPKIVNRLKRPPSPSPPPKPSSPPSSSSPSGSSGTQPKLFKSNDNSSSTPPPTGKSSAAGSYYVLAPNQGSQSPSVILLVPGKSFP